MVSMALLVKTRFHSLITIILVSTSVYGLKTFLTDCKDGTFGWNCRFDCKCKDGKTCDKINGTCDNGCRDDLMGGNCQLHNDTTVCPDYLFGMSCQQQCHCLNTSEVCNKTSGHCTSGCAYPWTGGNCQDCRRGSWGNQCDAKCIHKCNTGCYKADGKCCPKFKLGASCLKSLPSLRGDPWAFNVTSFSISVRWNKSINGITGIGFGSVFKYQLKYKGPSNGWKSVDVNSSKTEEYQDYEIRSLNYNTWYIVRVACYFMDEVGFIRGRYSNQIYIKTLCKDPSAVSLRKNVRSELNKDHRKRSSLTIEWESVEEIGCDSVEYILQYRRCRYVVGAIEDAWMNETIHQSIGGHPKNNHTINDLDVYTIYQIRIIAQNNDNLTSTSNLIQYRTAEGVSDAVKNITISSRGSHWIIVSWARPDRINSLNINYKVYRREKKSLACAESYSNDWVLANVESIASCNVSKLSPYREYEIKIVPVNGAGDGPSVTVFGQTKESKPSDVPANLKVDVLERTDVRIKWDLPPCVKQNGVIRYIQYRLYKIDASSIHNDPVKKYTKNYVQIKGLTPYTKYSFKVKIGTNDEPGYYSDYSEEITFRTLEDVSEAVVDIVTSSKGPNWLSVSWIKPHRTNGVITKYKLYYREISSLACPNSKSFAWDEPHEVHRTYYNISHLSPYRKYEIKIVPVNNAGNGAEHTITSQTDMSKPSDGPANLQVDLVERRYARLKWDLPPCRKWNGDIKYLQYSIRGLQYSTISREPVGLYTDFVKIDDLTPYALYGFKVKLATKNIRSFYTDYTDEITFRTLEDVPLQPEDVTSPNVLQSGFTVSWKPPNPPHGMIQNYTIAYRKKSETSRFIETTTATNRTSMDIGNVDPHTKYIVKVRATTKPGTGPWSNEITIYTDEGYPSKPELFSLEEKNQFQVSFAWREPKNPNGNIRGYRIRCNEDDYVEAAADIYSVTISGLLPGGQYNCSIQAKTSKGYGASQPLSFWTIPLAPSKPQITKEVEITDSTITFFISRGAGIGARRFEVHVDRHDTDTRSRRDTLNENAANFSQCDARLSKRDVYLAAVLTSNQARDSFVVGDGKSYGGYWNCPLVKGSVYSIYYAAVAINGDGDAYRTFAFVGTFRVVKEAWFLKIGIPILVFVSISVLIFSLWWIRCKKKQSHKNGRSTVNTDYRSAIPLLSKSPNPPRNITNTESFQNRENDEVTHEAEDVYANIQGVAPKFHNSINVDDILSYINSKRENNNAGFIAEYKSLPIGLLPTEAHTVGTSPVNKAKNRFANITAYDHSRVVLETLDADPFSDYINASHIKGYKCPNKYIASQGPNNVMVTDFWRMIWQYDVSRVVMVTNLVENRKMKCDKYWPSECDGDEQYGDINIHYEKEEILSDFTIRTLLMSKRGVVKTVWQFHYTAWPDHGVPIYSTSILSFRRKVKSYESISRGPITVHCSAGVGRTGTFIALDYLLDQAKAEGKIEVFSFVDYMRHQRVNMIQTLDQYIFLYNALFEGVRCGDTVITPTQFLSSFADYNKRDTTTNRSMLDQQFNLLLSLQISSEAESHSSATLEENIDKNRCMAILPGDSHRPYLSTPVANCTDYINAVFIDSYRQKNAFIVTQTPLPHTRVDLWRLVHDHSSSSIVMLNQLKAVDETCPPYWPEREGDTSSYGPFSILNKGNESQDDDELSIIKLELTYTSKIKTITRELKLFQVHDWSDGEHTPSSASTLLKLIDHVDHWQRCSGSKPVIIHCLDGAERSGIYVAIYHIMEKLKLEQEIDVFNTVRHIQINRRQLIGSKEQYTFCHDAVVEFLKANELYSNFT